MKCEHPPEYVFYDTSVYGAIKLKAFICTACGEKVKAVKFESETGVVPTAEVKK